MPRDVFAGSGPSYASDLVTATGAYAPVGSIPLLPVSGALAFGLDPVVSARATMILFFGALLVGVWLCGIRLGGRWAGLVAATTAVVVSTTTLGLPLDGFAILSGVIPAAAFLVWASYNLSKRPWLSGVLAGLAVQSQLLAALAIPIMLVVLLSIPQVRKSKARILRGFSFTFFALLPTLSVAVVNLIRLGPSIYWAHLQSSWRWTVEAGMSEPLSTVAAIVLFAVVPLLITYLFRESLRIWKRGRWAGRALVIMVAAGMAVSTAPVVLPSVLARIGHETLPEQRVAATAMETAGITAVRGDPGPAESVAFLAGAEFHALDDAADSIPLIIANPARGELGQTTFKQIVSEQCERVVVRAENYVVCIGGQ
ncbi:hypothetical protein [Homoserinimonas sp. OAct 916]|uniref:hypothetical protein n=1 Tax=Homoserinimonas sp. OAct 916 TaxID=2211450 RepID=UPI00130024F5|nr:hypothetical protein [Homoserinimonas sp. OAct 916]